MYKCENHKSNFIPCVLIPVPNKPLQCEMLPTGYKEAMNPLRTSHNSALFWLEFADDIAVLLAWVIKSISPFFTVNTH